METDILKDIMERPMWVNGWEVKNMVMDYGLTTKDRAIKVSGVLENLMVKEYSS